MPQSTPLRIGTRGSRLALTQAGIVRDLLAREGIESEVVVVKTSGDRIQDRPLADAGGKGLFTKELEEALFANEADIAVHSMKDVPAHLPDGLILGAYLPREDPRDVLVSNKSHTLQSCRRPRSLEQVRCAARAQLLRARQDVEAVTLARQCRYSPVQIGWRRLRSRHPRAGRTETSGHRGPRDNDSRIPMFGCRRPRRAPSASNCAPATLLHGMPSPN